MEAWNQLLVYLRRCESIVPVVFEIVSFGEGEEDFMNERIIVQRVRPSDSALQIILGFVHWSVVSKG